MNPSIKGYEVMQSFLPSIVSRHVSSFANPYQFHVSFDPNLPAGNSKLQLARVALGSSSQRATKLPKSSSAKTCETQSFEGSSTNPVSLPITIVACEPFKVRKGVRSPVGSFFRTLSLRKSSKVKA
jgi:hypothetical protein